MKRALVTGGSSPIGSAVSQKLAAQGMHVLVHANKNMKRAADCVDTICAFGGSAELFQLDLSDQAASSTLSGMAKKAPIQVLVHCVGAQKDKPFAAMDAADWASVIDVNLTSLFTVLQPLIMPMMRTRWGRIIALSSLTAVRGNRGQANYAAAKGGLLPFVKTLTHEYGSRGITANVVAPGLIETPDTLLLDNYEDLVQMAPAKRAGQVGEVAALVGFLASEQAGYISGQQICIDGGSS